MKNPVYLMICFVLLSLLFKVEDGTAQKLTGKLIYSNPSPAEIKTVNGATYKKQVFDVRIEMDDTNSPFHNTTGISEGWSVSSGGGDAFISNFFLFADKEGDTYCSFGSNRKIGDRMKVSVKGGTGKFANLEGAGTASVVLAPDTGKAGDIGMQTWEVTLQSNQ